MVNSCVASNCTQRHEKGVTFHGFPKNEEVRKKWIEAIKIMRPKWEPTQNSQLCHKHFGKDCYETSKSSSLKRLKKDAVPTIFSVSTRTAILLGLLENDMEAPTAQLEDVSVSDDVGTSTIKHCNPDIEPAQSSTVLDACQHQDPQVLDVWPAPTPAVLDIWPAQTIESLGVSPVSTIKVEAISPPSTPEVADSSLAPTPEVLDICSVTTIKVEAISRASTPEVSDISLDPTSETVDVCAAPTPRVVEVCPAKTPDVLPVCNGAEDLTPDTPPTKRKKREYYIGDFTSQGDKVLVKAKEVIRKKNMQLKVERKRVARMAKKITELEEKVESLKQKLSSQESAAILMSGPENCRALFAQMLTAGSQGKEYPDELKSFAVTLEFYSPKAYDYVRKTFNNCLPHRRTLQKWHQTVSSEPDISNKDLETSEFDVDL